MMNTDEWCANDEVGRALRDVRDDPAQLCRFVDRYGAAIAAMLRDAGAPPPEVDALVLDVAFAVLDLVASSAGAPEAAELLHAACAAAWPTRSESTRRPASCVGA